MSNNIDYSALFSNKNNCGDAEEIRMDVLRDLHRHCCQ